MKRNIIPLLTILLALLAWSPWTSPVAAQAAVPRFEPGPCPVDVPGQPRIECGTLVAPENYEQPEGRTVRLPIIIIRSPNPNPAPDPLLVTLGGPGYTSVGAVWGYASNPFVQERDIVILEQRGNLHARPSLDCDLSMLEEAGEGRTPCLDSLLAQGIDPQDYTAADIARDLEALFEALDYEQWNLLGSSFSTRLMLLAMRDYPERIRSVILQSVNSPLDTRYVHDPEHSARALDVLFEDCEHDPICAAAYPDLEARFYALYSRLNAEPLTFELTDLDGGETVSRTVTGYTLLDWTVGDAFYGAAHPPQETAYLPLLIDALEAGRTDIAYPWVKERWKQISSEQFAWGLYFAVNCQDDMRPDTAAVMAGQAKAYPELEGYLRHRPEVEICQAWGLPTGGPLLDAPLQSDIPTLVLAGSYDPITPPAWGRETAEHLANATYVEFAAEGHDMITGNPCTLGIMNDFLRNPAQELETSCALAAPQFVTPDEVLVVPNFYEYYVGHIGRNSLEHQAYLQTENALPLAILFVLLVLLVWLVLWRWRKVPFSGLVCAGLALAGLASVLLYGFSLQMRAVVRRVTAQGTLLRFGVPPDIMIWFVIALVAALLVVALLALIVYAWLRRRGPLLTRLALTLAPLPPLGFAVLMGLWG